MASTQPDTSLDLRFLRFTGVALVVATLVSGVVTLSLTVGESRALYLAQEAQKKVPLNLAASLENTFPTE
ncbi:MAG TPA: hypothetical protein VM144_00935 [Aestuariivirga sp.]|nr:hypothetical protein [Aestuariivirga sp.]